RHLAIADDGQRVLAGDFCYAQGLATVAASGDLDVVDALAELVALSSVAVAQGAQEVLPPLWAGTIAVIVAPEGAPAGRFRTARAAFRERGERAPPTALAAELRVRGVGEALGACPARVGDPPPPGRRARRGRGGGRSQPRDHRDRRPRRQGRRARAALPPRSRLVDACAHQPVRERAAHRDGARRRAARGPGRADPGPDRAPAPTRPRREGPGARQAARAGVVRLEDPERRAGAG